MNVILLYSGDAWLSRESLSLMAVCTDKETAVKMAVDAAGYTDDPLDEESQTELLNEYQTYGRDENFMIVATELNILI